ncbi:uncharacterized protein LOC110721116 [Chenopodium quinoa]|uniref:uncharacterized protein LOC110721116 n=1 Tax=Chenopodium quinoa TaxID=63459 RepID=UPI000B76BA9F|nr:uncharacterized protein LOC110721116 [Chenopodium quinoa]
MRLKHMCVRSKENKKVTAEFIVERYLEEFRSNPTWKIKQIRDRVLQDLRVQVTYYRCWMARCRAKLIIFGSATEQYARVWDYGKAIMRYNPGSGCNVVVDGIVYEDVFMFEAFERWILVVVSKDGNNNIYPIAWATCEAENRETWVWFLESLMHSLGSADGSGFTFMSDRQKGLVEALAEVVPSAETRFCVRHIWSNFKLKFSGSMFKELFWSAARATTHLEFQIQMQEIRELNEQAYQYLNNIPTQHWCRHAFSDSCRSNMLLNNMCETFNSVIRDARDKPILTQMEWMRRDDTFEVQLNDDQVLVDLENGTCSCNHWQLIGIPCVHAFACIMDQRSDAEQYVHPFYSMESYRAAYEPAIQPMPGPKHWETRGQQRAQRRKSQCKSCGGFGHYAKTCKRPTVPEPTDERTAGRPPLNSPWVVEQRKKSEIKAAKKSAVGASPNSIGNKTFP